MRGPGAQGNRLSLGSGTAITHPGTDVSSNLRVAMRNGHLAVVTGVPAALSGGVSTGFPSLQALLAEPSRTMSTANADLAISPTGEART